MRMVTGKNDSVKKSGKWSVYKIQRRGFLAFGLVWPYHSKIIRSNLTS